MKYNAELIPVCVVDCICRESHKLMMHAASKGVHDARRAVQELCSKGRCPWVTQLHWCLIGAVAESAAGTYW